MSLGPIYSRVFLQELAIHERKAELYTLIGTSIANHILNSAKEGKKHYTWYGRFEELPFTVQDIVAVLYEKFPGTTIEVVGSGIQGIRIDWS